jgi:hypothetical protein
MGRKLKKKVARKPVKKTVARRSSPRLKSKRPGRRPSAVRQTVVSFVLDETGSMQSCKDATISGFNEYINTLKSRKDSKDILFTLTRFNSASVQVNPSGVPITLAPVLTESSYRPENNTPLYDAIGRTIADVSHTVNGLGSNPAVLVVIMTDGDENASKEYTGVKILKLVEEKTKAGWTFAFLGANLDAFKAGSSIGISSGNTMQYYSDPAGTKLSLRSVAIASSTYLSNKSAQTVSFFSSSAKPAKKDPTTTSA